MNAAVKLLAAHYPVLQIVWPRFTGHLGAHIVIRPGNGVANPAVPLLLVSSGRYALYQIATRWIAAFDGAATGIIFAALLGSLVTSLVLPFVFVPPRNVFDVPLFVFLGPIGGCGHYLLIRAFQHAPAAAPAPLGYLELVGTTILGYPIFGNFPDRWTWIGAGIIIASGLYIAFRERRRRASGARRRTAEKGVRR